MATILEKVKSVFAKKEKTNVVKATSKSKTKRKVKKKLAPEKEIAGKLQLKESVGHNGYYSISVKSLFKLFGFQQCRSMYFPVINNWMNDEGLYIFPSLTSETK